MKYKYEYFVITFVFGGAVVVGLNCGLISSPVRNHHQFDYIQAFHFENGSIV